MGRREDEHGPRVAIVFSLPPTSMVLSWRDFRVDSRSNHASFGRASRASRVVDLNILKFQSSSGDAAYAVRFRGQMIGVEGKSERERGVNPPSETERAARRNVLCCIKLSAAR